MGNYLDSTVLDFYSKNNNSQRIVEIYNVYKHIEDFVAGILECSKDSLLKSNLNSMKMEFDAKRDFVKYYFPKTGKNVMLTVFFRDNLFSTNSAPHIHIAFEVQGNCLISMKTILILLYLNTKMLELSWQQKPMKRTGDIWRDKKSNSLT